MRSYELFCYGDGVLNSYQHNITSSTQIYGMFSCPAIIELRLLIKSSEEGPHCNCTVRGQQLPLFKRGCLCHSSVNLFVVPPCFCCVCEDFLLLYTVKQRQGLECV